MPPPRKIDLMPSEFQDWLKQSLKARGFSGYEQLAEELNFKLEEAGLEMSIGKSAVHAFGQDYQEFVKVQKEASAWAANWMTENGLEDEAQRQNVLFQMMTASAFKVLKAQLEKPGEEINPQNLQLLGRMMKDLMSSSGIREKLLADDRERIAKEAREKVQKEMTEAFDETLAAEPGLSDARIAEMRNKFLGVRA